MQMQRRPVQADRAQRLATHLLQAGEHVLDARSGLGNAPVAALLAIRQRLASLPLALECMRQPRAVRRCSRSLST